MAANDASTVSSSTPTPSVNVRDPAYCRDVIGLYRVEARRLIGRIMSGYLDEAGLTPIELLHCYDHALALANAGTRLAGFVQQVAIAQVTLTGQPIGERTRELFSYTDAALMQAKTLSEKTNADPLTVEQLDALCADETNLRAAHAALSRYLLGAAGWMEKIERVLILFDAGPGPAAAAVLDDLLGEILARSPALDTVLGASVSRVEAIGQILALVRREAPMAVPAGRCGPQLASLFVTRDLPICGTVLMAHAKRILDAGGPIASKHPADEFTALRRIADLVQRGNLPLGPDNMMSLIESRMGRLITAETLAKLVPEVAPHFRRIDLTIRLIDEAIGNVARSALNKFLTFLLDEGSLNRSVMTSRQPPANQALEIEGLIQRLKVSAVSEPRRTAFVDRLRAIVAKLQSSGVEKRGSPRRTAASDDYVILRNAKIPLLNWSALGLKFGPVDDEIKIGQRVRLAVRVRSYRGPLTFEAEADVLRVVDGQAAAKYRCVRGLDDQAIKAHFTYVAKAKKIAS